MSRDGWGIRRARADRIASQGWFIFTTLLLLMTLRSTLAFFLLFFFLDVTFLLLGIAYLELDDGTPRIPVVRAGGYFGLITAFLAWYNAFAGVADSSNRYVSQFLAGGGGDFKRPVTCPAMLFPRRVPYRRTLEHKLIQAKLDCINSFFVAPVVHFPWSDKGREKRSKTERNMV